MKWLLTVTRHGGAVVGHWTCTERASICASPYWSVTSLLYYDQWGRYVVKYGGQGQSGQAIKLFQITPYVTDFQTINNPGSRQPVGGSKN